MAEAFGIACHELVSLDFRCGSQPEVSDGHENVGFRGQSGSRFRGAGCLLVAISGLSRHVPMSVPDRFCDTVTPLGSSQIGPRIAARIE